ncbi:coenzyme F420-0:L-glutamate ligase [Rubrobacter marinus]|uniref:coenzyme F420-0:L-glutamate ligase n=1 Tax=Rubrobacter marinus TaxID=2653852 RepID=UPI00140D5E89|nr:coenzyme F420-0:L-glutamate ligase [Rubrobacter marinus]
MSLYAVVPVKDLAGAKSRLGPVLDPRGRATLTLTMMRNVLSALREAEVERAYVVSPDPDVLDAARAAGATPLRQRSRGMNPALEEARERAVADGATSLLVFPADLPLLRAADVEAVVGAGDGGRGRLAAVAPDAAGKGTNGLLLSPPDALPFLFGADSFAAHLGAAGERGVEARVVERPNVGFDLDTADDLRRLAEPAVAAQGRPGELRVMPVPGFPEVRSGEDLPGLVARSVGDDLRAGDVVVVTHKVISKAEGRLVDLRTIEPSAFAKGFGARWEKDPRQIEVVLRESRRIVRMERGIIISETHHGFVCANAGVDASNVPGEETVCLLPLDPDASAARIRDALVARAGADVAVVVSDSFGRPWRNGITDVAVGVAGMEPLIDYRGGFDPHGHPLTASILAVADELAAAAELVMGKTDGIPVAVVRGYAYGRGDGSGKDLLMEPEKDMFR